MPFFGGRAREDCSVGAGSEFGIVTEHSQPTREALEHRVGKKAWRPSGHDDPSLALHALAAGVRFRFVSNLQISMAETEWWQRGPIEGVPSLLQPVAHILLQVRESVGEFVDGLTEEQFNARPAGVASAAFHLQHITGVIDRLFTYARGAKLSDAQFAALRREREPLTAADVAPAIQALDAQVDAAIAELRTIDPSTLGDWRGVGRSQLPSTVIGCLVHGAEHAMRHVGQLSVTVRVVRGGAAS